MIHTERREELGQAVGRLSGLYEAVTLWQATAEPSWGTAAKSRKRLEFGVGVGANFAVEVDFFVLRGGPFHEVAPWEALCDSGREYHDFAGEHSRSEGQAG